MRRDHIEYININVVCSDLKKKYIGLTVIEREKEVLKELSEGIKFKDIFVNISSSPFFNPLANRENRWYFFVCPSCQKNVRRLYFIANILKCGKCHKYADKYQVKISTPSDKMLRIQDYLNMLLDTNSGLTTKKKKQYMALIEKHYTELDPLYKKTFNNFLIKGLTSWCSETLKDKEKSDDYKEALGDVLKKLKMMKFILVQKKMKKEKDLR